MYHITENRGIIEENIDNGLINDIGFIDYDGDAIYGGNNRH